MALIDPALLASPVVPDETVTVGALGGDVSVRGLYLSERLVMISEQERMSQPQGDETAEQAHARAGGDIMPFILAPTVRGEGGVPLFTREQWRNFSVKESAAVLRLYAVVMRLSGNDVEQAAKN